jgi:hypothetical protein
LRQEIHESPGGLRLSATSKLFCACSNLSSRTGCRNISSSDLQHTVRVQCQYIDVAVLGLFSPQFVPSSILDAYNLTVLCIGEKELQVLNRIMSHRIIRIALTEDVIILCYMILLPNFGSSELLLMAES